MHERLNLPRLNVRRKQHLANFMFKRSQITKFVDNRNLLTRNGEKKLLKVIQPKFEKTKNDIISKKI